MNSGAADTEGNSARSGWLKRLLPIVVLAAVAALVISQGWHSYLSMEQLAKNRDALKAFLAENYVGALLAYSAIYIVTVALSLPGGIFLTLTGGFLFGWIVGGIVTVIAATIGSAIVFLIAKTSLGEPLAARAGPWLGKLREGFQENALSYLLFLRLVPIFPFWLVNLAPALLGVGFGTYVLGTFFGIIPGTFAFTFLGVGLDSIIDEQKASHARCVESGRTDCELAFDPAALVTTELLIAFAALGLVALIPVLLKKLRRKAPPA